MSRFFNETSTAGNIDPNPPSSAIDITAAVASAKEHGKTNGSAPSHLSDADINRLVRPLQESDDVSFELALERLARCRRITLPRKEERSFLVTQYDPAMQAAVEAYRTLRTRLSKQQAKNGMRSIVVSSAGQGEGKSLTTFNLALCYAKIQNFPLLLIDADLRSQGLSRLLGQPGSPGLAGILEGDMDYQSAILGTDFPGLYVLPAGDSTSSPPELFASSRWKEFMGWATETFRLTIVDCAPVLSVADFELVVASCDNSMLVVRSRKTTGAALSKALAQLDLRKLAGVVFNGTEEPVNGYYPTA